MKRNSIKWFLHKPGSSSINFVHVPEFSYGKPNTGNIVIKSDNIEVLREIAPVAKGLFRCIYIDPPYNNRERYTHYNDDISHESWLENITLRLKYFLDLLSDDGSLWISIDDKEMHYLKVAADKIFGRKNFVTTIVWEHRTTRENRKTFSNNHEYLLVYAKNPLLFRKTRHRLNITAEALSRYKNPDNDPRGPWQSVSANVQAGHATKSQFYEIIAPNGRSHNPPKGRCWIYNREKMEDEISKNNIWFGKRGDGVPRLKVFLNNGSDGLTPHTLWSASDVGTTKSAKKHMLQMFQNESLFDTPKPENLIHRILSIATDPGDWVLDTYLGSGTTVAVAHKMGRHYVGVEVGIHAITHCARRLRLIIDGESGGISKMVDWKGMGGFDFFGFRGESG